jgi:hypothetical protein
VYVCVSVGNSHVHIVVVQRILPIQVAFDGDAVIPNDG